MLGALLLHSQFLVLSQGLPLAAEQGLDNIIVQSSTEQTALDEVNVKELFFLAQELAKRGAFDEAIALLTAVEADPDPAYRAEAKARLARIHIAKGDLRTAAKIFQKLLDENPDAAGARVELADILLRLGNENGAGKQIRRAAATPGIPDDVSRALGRYNTILRSNAPFIGNFEIGLAPDSNINRATQNREIDLFGLPFQLDRDGRATSGIGLTAGANGLFRKKIGDNARLNFQIGGNGSFYKRGSFNDISANSSIGVDIFDENRSISLPVTISRRWIGQEKLYDQVGLSPSIRFALSPKSQLQASAAINHFSYADRSDLSGNIYALNLAYERAITPTLSSRAAVYTTKNATNSDINKTNSYGGEILLSKDWRSVNFFGKASYSRIQGEVIYRPFSVVRKDDFFEGEAGIIFRNISWYGLSPLIRFRRSKSNSNVPLFDYSRSRMEVAVTGTF